MIDPIILLGLYAPLGSETNSNKTLRQLLYINVSKIVYQLREGRYIETDTLKREKL